MGAPGGGSSNRQGPETPETYAASEAPGSSPARGGWFRPVLRIARYEGGRYTQLLNRRLIIVALFAGLLVGALWPAIQDGGVHPEAGLYIIAVDDGSPVHAIASSDPAFTIQPTAGAGSPRTSQLDLLVRGETVAFDPDSERSKAAARQLELATRQWLDNELTYENDQAAAFPVGVNLVFVPRDPGAALPQDPGDGATGGTDPDADPGAGAGPGADPGAEDPADPSAQAQSLGQSTDQRTGLRPDEIDPPFPLRGLLLTFAYLIPLTFISEFYSGSIFSERVRGRGVLLLSAPVTSAQVLVGKSLPYIGVTLVVAIATTVAIGSNAVGLAAALPVIALALAAALFIAIVARSQRALTFLLVSTNVLLSTFLFLPAIFVEVPSVAFLSPVSVIAATIEGQSVGVAPFLYATVPMAVGAAVVTRLSVALYREETLFAPRGIASKLVDAIRATTPDKRRLFAAGALAVPFALALQVFILIFAVTLDLGTAFVVFLIGAATAEEMLKGLPAYAHGQRPGKRVAGPVGLAVLVGTGFFLGEKATLAFTLLGLDLLPHGEPALATFGIAASPLLVLAPLILHIVTTAVTAHAARAGKAVFAVGLVTAVAIHVAYNLTVVHLVTGGGFL